MKKKKKLCFPKPILKKLLNDIKKQIPSNEGKLWVLEKFEEIPCEIRHFVLEGLSSFRENEIVELFQLIKMEYGKELEAVANRALNKMSMAGLNICPPEIFAGSFLTAYVSRSRHTGRITLDVAWDTGEKGIHLECFYLTFNPDGIYSFYFIEGMSSLKYEQYKNTLKDIVEINFEESSYLISQAYNFNVRFMSRPALGRFLYQKYLNKDIKFSPEKARELIRKISKKLTCRQQINSFFYGLKNRDYNYLLYCLSKQQATSENLEYYFKDILKTEVIFLEGQVEKIFVFNKTARVTGYSIIIEDNNFYKNDYLFQVIKDKDGIWLINNIEKKKNELLETNSKLVPFNYGLYCRVYEILDLDELFEILDSFDNLRIIEEIPYGVHMRLTCYQDNFNCGISFFSGAIADIVVNANEFIILARELSNIMEIHNDLTNNQYGILDFQGEYEISLLTAFRYMGGQYIKFDDVLRDAEDTFAYEDGMCFLCARYLVKDIEPVKKQLTNWQTIQLRVYNEYEVFYQIEKQNGVAVFFAEYILGPNWITISTFGDQDMNIARKDFEDKIYDCLEFNGMEIREDGIFGILTADIKKEYPDLEAILKEIYLNKWFNSRLAVLSGMSPSEACQTEEGSRLLWTMFKRLHQKKKKNYFYLQKDKIGLKEYIQKVEKKNAKKH